MTSRVVRLPVDDNDTDQIIPARFLKVTDRSGLGAALFADWRYQPDGTLRVDFPLNQPDVVGAQILVAGRNFGCGSSREHAPWALVGFGLRAVIAPSFADIFRSNALKNGLLPVELDGKSLDELEGALQRARALPVTIDLHALTVHWPDGPLLRFTIDAFSQKCLLEGYDELAYLLAQEERIRAHEARR
jgi:3-isopropylmalate/(R)-2-methylmalate dehydratase small subunit